MRKYTIKINHETFLITIVGLTFLKELNSLELLERVNEISKDIGVNTIIVNPSIVCSPIQLCLACKYALEAHKRGKNISKKLELEVLLYTIGKRQISEVLNKASIKGKVKDVVIVIVSDTEEKVNELLNRLYSFLKYEMNDKLMNLTEDKVEIIKNIFNISYEELKATYARNLHEALVKCVLSRVTSLRIKK